MFVLSLVYLVLTIIRPQDYLPILNGVPLLPAVLVLAFLFWVASSAKTFAAPQFILLPAFLFALVMSELANSWVGGALDQLTQFGPTVVAFFVLAAAVSVNRRRVVITLGVFALCAMVLALHGVDQFNHGVGWTGMALSEDRRIRYIGIFNDPNDLGLLLVAALPMTVYLSAQGGFLRRAFWLGGALLLLYAIYLTNSRGAFLAVMVIFGIYLQRTRGLFTALTLGGVGILGMLMLPSRVQDLDVDDPSAFGRVDAWYEGLQMFRAHPIFGVGAGNFTDYNYLTAHNSMVLVLAETGFFGYILWIAFVGYSLMMTLRLLRHRVEGAEPKNSVAVREKGSFRAPSNKERDAERGIALTLLLSLCGTFATMFFLSRSYTIIIYLLISVVVGNFVGARRRLPDIPQFSLVTQGWIWIPIAAGSIAFLFVVVTVLLHNA